MTQSIGDIKIVIKKTNDSDERIVEIFKGDFGSYSVEYHTIKILKGWTRNGGNGWSYEKEVSASYPTIKGAVINYLQNKRKNKY